MSRPTTATVVLPVAEADAGLQTVLRDLAVAAYGLRRSGTALRLLAVEVGQPVGDVIAAQTKGTDLTVEVLSGPTANSGAAYLAGFARAVADDPDLVITMDANGRHDATQIPGLVNHLVERDADVVIGSRWARGSGTPGLTISRWLLGRLANVVFRFVTGARGVRDATTSFRVCRSHTVRSFRFDGVPVSSHSVQTAFVASALAQGFKVVEAPIIYREALAGGGALTSRDVADFVDHLGGLRALVSDMRGARLTPAGRAFTDEHFGAADDLERLGTANHFFNWVLDEFEPWLRGRLLEVGAGTGTITRKLHERFPDTAIVALEPADNMFAELDLVTALSPRVEARHETLETYQPDEPFDAALYLNVLEHIPDDVEELRRVAQVLKPGAALLVFGPAHEWLYSELDYKAGHYRRYTTGGIRRSVEEAGFDVVSVRYFDVFGVPPYWAVYRVLRHTTITGGSLWGYDRLVVPLSRAVQRAVPHPPMGKNVILVAVRRQA